MVEGALEAPSQREAVEKIAQMGLLPVRVEESGPPSVPKQPPVAPRASSSVRIRSREITVFSRQLAILLKSGVPILNALHIIAGQSGNPSFRLILTVLHDAIKDGATFSSMLKQFPAVFPPLYIALVRTGEDSGALPQALIRIVNYRTKGEEMVSRLRMALAYPLLMALIGIGTIVFMLTFVMPRLMGIFTSMGQNLPLPTKLLIGVSQGLLHNWFWFVLVFSAAAWVSQRQAATKKGKLFFCRLMFHLPLFGDFMLKADLARFSRTLELLIHSGIPILRALDLGSDVLGNEILKEEVRKSCAALEQGGSLGKSLAEAKLFPSFMTNLIAVGEESGKLEDAMAEVADIYESETDEAMKIAASLLEPLMILAMGLVVGFMVVAMLLPIFEINMMVK